MLVFSPSMNSLRRSQNIDNISTRCRISRIGLQNLEKIFRKIASHGHHSINQQLQMFTKQYNIIITAWSSCTDLESWAIFLDEIIVNRTDKSLVFIQYVSLQQTNKYTDTCCHVACSTNRWNKYCKEANLCQNNSVRFNSISVHPILQQKLPYHDDAEVQQTIITVQP